MHVEKVNDGTFKATLTYSEATERGITLQDFLFGSQRGKEVIDEAVDFAIENLGIEVFGPLKISFRTTDKFDIIIEISRIYQAQMTQEELTNLFGFDQDMSFVEPNEKMNDFMKTLDEISKPVVHDVAYVFRDIEDVIELSKKVYEITDANTRLFFYKNQYYLTFENLEDDEMMVDLLSIVSEFGVKSKVSIPVLAEYGKTICDYDAVGVLKTNFEKNRG